MTTLFPENNWRDLMQNTWAAIEATMGEGVTVTPVRSGGVNFPTIPEPEKTVTATAVFTRKATSALGGGRLHNMQAITPLVSTSKPIFQFGYNALPFPLRQYYRIKLLRTGEIYEVTDIKADGVACITVDVVQLGRQKIDGPGIVATPVPPIVMGP
ncbi:hypothetical protein MTR72_24860 [Bradyrhizobium sp. ISRA442]|uniref:hypothetical protein n=1 Tax=Bradyrhizobium sp. ISRA442 TaxID=2866197 RepID=UPI00311B156B